MIDMGFKDKLESWASHKGVVRNKRTDVKDLYGPLLVLQMWWVLRTKHNHCYSQRSKDQIESMTWFYPKHHFNAFLNEKRRSVNILYYFILCI